MTAAPQPRPIIVAPTYNHAAPLGDVLDALGTLGLPIIAVNDGSTDTTADALAAWADAQPPDSPARIVLTHPRNRGKAAALRTGFDHAADAGYTHAMTLDTDGQHDAADAPALLDAMRQHPAALILGTRSPDGQAVPWPSRVGRAASDRLVRRAAGQPIRDSQSGMRIYPLTLRDAVACRAQRYAFESEVLIRAAWAGVPIIEVPIRTLYQPAGQRISHFRKCADSTRCIAVILSLLLRGKR